MRKQGQATDSTGKDNQTKGHEKLQSTHEVKTVANKTAD